MTDKKVPLGPTGRTVQENVRRLRGGMQYKELSERLEAVGRPIASLGLRRIEAGERRVDVDDLVALAVVFGVSPLTLLLPADGTRYASSYLTGIPDRKVSHNTQWLWALGEEPLELPGLGQTNDALREKALYQFKAKPEVEDRSTAVGYVVNDDDKEQEGEMLTLASKLITTQGLDRSRGND